MSDKLKFILAGALLLGTASVALADATEDYSNYPLANAYKYCNRGVVSACVQAQQLNAEDNAMAAFGSAAYPVAPAPIQHRTHRHRTQ